MSNFDLTSVLFILLLLVALAQLLGYVFVKLGQPKVVGEILAGIVLGPAVVGRLSSASWILVASQHQANILNFVYWLGLLLLMFLSGAETQRLFSREERREVGWLAIVGTGIPFVLGLVTGPWLIRPSLAGPNGNRISLVIILAVGVAVTSVPVVSKIFADLKILHTRFARLVLGVAVLEDIVLWLALAVATALAGQTVLNLRQMSFHLLTTVGFFGLSLTIVPRMVKRLNKSKFNVFAKQSPVAYAIRSSRLLCGGRCS
jgi:Kef-type K+ transport system membrane component KefB